VSKLNEYISVIVPVYNAGEKLRTCITSILNQSHTRLELLLINDGSTDGSGQLCEQFALLDPRVKAYHQPRGGAGKARNSGLLAATGQYVAFVDADDSLEPGFLHKLYCSMLHYQCEVVVSGFRTLPDNKAIVPGFRLNTPMDGRTFILSSATVHSSNDLCFVWRSLYSMDAISRHDIRFDETLAIGEDTIFNLQVYTNCRRICAIADTLYNYSVGYAGSLMNTAHMPQLGATLELQYLRRRSFSAASGLLAAKHYRRDLADYCLKAILAMLIRNMQSSPGGLSKSALSDLLRAELVTTSARELGFWYTCRNLKEYGYFLAVKFKLTSLLHGRMQLSAPPHLQPLADLEQRPRRA
jgi:glycosyltransferase EpsJ